MKKYLIKNGPCGVEQVFRLIGSRWKPRIMQICYSTDSIAISTLKEELPNCPKTTLYRQVNNLVETEMLSAVSESEPMIYQLTQKSKDLVPALLLMQEFALACDFPNSGYDSSIEYAKSLIGQKWKSRIIWTINACGPIRFNELQRTIDGISHKVLQEQLENMQISGLLLKQDFNEQPPRTEYSLTETGKLAFELVQKFADWAKKYGLIKVQVEISSLN